jgi:hypothetical protein
VGSFAFQKPGFFGEAGLLFFKVTHYRPRTPIASIGNIFDNRRHRRFFDYSTSRRNDKVGKTG